MTSRSESIKNTLNKLSQNSGSSGQRIHVRIDKSAAIKIYAACIFPQKILMLEIGPIKSLWLPQGFQKPRIKGLNLVLKPIEQLPDSDVTLLLELQQNDSIDVFSVFMARICDELDKVSHPKLAVKTIISLITTWKDFFSGNSEILSEERQTGLFGELYLLYYFVAEGVDIGKTISSWTGSKKTSQDYEFGSVSVEVKSSTAVDTSRVKISNLRQLDNKGLANLFLARVLFDTRQGKDETLPRLIQLIRTELQEKAPDSELEFEEKLISAGYHSKHSQFYGNRMYAMRKLTFYRVKNDFPRLLEDGVPLGITKVSYEINLDNCRDFIIDDKKVMKTVRVCCD